MRGWDWVLVGLCAAWLLALVAINSPDLSPSQDLPAWLQASAAFIALTVTAFQWWTARRDAGREKRARQLAGYAVLVNIHAAMTFQAKRLVDVGEKGGPNTMGRYAGSMLQSGFDLMERQALAIPVADLPLGGVEAVMAGQTAVHGIRQALEGLVEVTQGETATSEDVEFSVEYLQHSLDRLLESANLLHRAVLAGH